MSELYPSVELALNVLVEAAKKDPALLRDRREELMALAKAAGLETLSAISAAFPADDQQYPLMVGKTVKHPGIPFGQLKSGRYRINLNLIPDFLRDETGNVALLKSGETVSAIAALNGGLKYGNGYEKALTEAVAKGQFKDGTLIFARKDDLIKLAREWDIHPALGQMDEILHNHSHSQNYCTSSTEQDDPGFVDLVNLSWGGNTDWSRKNTYRSRVVVLRGVSCD